MIVVGWVECVAVVRPADRGSSDRWTMNLARPRQSAGWLWRFQLAPEVIRVGRLHHTAPPMSAEHDRRIHAVARSGPTEQYPGFTGQREGPRCVTLLR